MRNPAYSPVLSLHLSSNPRCTAFRRNLLAWAIPLALELCVVSAAPARATQIWNGPITTFTLAPGSDPTQPTNQDRMTPHVWITRASSQGIYNAFVETSYTHYFSPADTEWSYGSLSNYASLTYTNWEGWNGGSHSVPNMISNAAVVHLISDDIYLALTFTSWGEFGVGGFSYQRSTPMVTAPPPPHLTNLSRPSPGTFRFTFTSTPGLTFSVLAATNATVPLSNWGVRGVATDSPPGSGAYQFTDPAINTNPPRTFYRVRWP